MTIDEAYELGIADGLKVKRDAIGLFGSGRREPIVIVDGSMYSPSWRACPQGERVYRAAEANPDLAEAYAEGLDYMTDNAPDWLSLYWEDGMLWAETVKQ